MAHHRTPFVLAADIDGTLLGDQIGTASLKLLFDRRLPQVKLALVTGRCVDLWFLLLRHRLPVQV